MILLPWTTLSAMSGPRWWISFERLDAVFRISVNLAIAAATVAAICWILTYALAAALGIIVATTASLIALFSWLRRDDLRGKGRPGD
ncbi:MAG: hypothetical protein GEU82_13810 [Luteitalea sp.]|nr:hypothetical protein [Luteitalea sp.]